MINKMNRRGAMSTLFAISMLAAGATPAIEVKDRSLIVTGRKADEDSERNFLHRGIATRAFERRFHLADHVRVTGASHVDGMLNIDLVREVPEALKPRRIEIAKAPEAEANVIEAEKVN